MRSVRLRLERPQGESLGDAQGGVRLHGLRSLRLPAYGSDGNDPAVDLLAERPGPATPVMRPEAIRKMHRPASGSLPNSRFQVISISWATTSAVCWASDSASCVSPENMGRLRTSRMLPSCVTAMLSVDSSTYRMTASPLAASGWFADDGRLGGGHRGVHAHRLDPGFVERVQTARGAARTRRRRRAAMSCPSAEGSTEQTWAMTSSGRDGEAILQAAMHRPPGVAPVPPRRSRRPRRRRPDGAGTPPLRPAGRIRAPASANAESPPASPCCGGPACRMSSPGKDLPASGPSARRGRATRPISIPMHRWAFSALARFSLHSQKGGGQLRTSDPSGGEPGRNVPANQVIRACRLSR